MPMRKSSSINSKGDGFNTIGAQQSRKKIHVFFAANRAELFIGKRMLASASRAS
jgi:hypothetical protein